MRRALEKQRGLIVLLGVSIFALTADGETLSKAKLLELHKAGVDSQTLITLIRNDGVGFSVDADATLELKRAGVGDDVLHVLLDQKATPKPAAPAATTPYSPAQQAYSSGDFAKAAESLRGILKSSPNDARAQALLAMACIKARDVACGESAYADLQKNTSPAAAPLRDRVAAVFDDLHEQENVKHSLETSLRRFDREGCLKAIRESKLAPSQKTVLEAWIDVYSGDYAKAREKVQGLPADLGKDLLPTFADYEKRAKSSQCALFWGSGEVSCPITQEFKDEYIQSIREVQSAGSNMDALNALMRKEQARQLVRFETQALQLFQVAPLSPSAANYLFQMAFLIKPYAEAKAFNDNLLATMGTITMSFRASKIKTIPRITMATANQRFTVDARNHKLLLSPGPLATEQWKLLESIQPSPTKLVYQDLPVSPIELSFSDIRSLRQKLKVSYGIPSFYESETTVVDIGNRFVILGGVPSLLMQLNPQMGELVLRQYMQDFGRYISSLNSENPGQPNLVEVKASKPGPGGFTKFLLLAADLATIAAPDVASGRLNLQTLGQAIESIYNTFSSTNTASLSGSSVNSTWEQVAIQSAMKLISNQSFVALEGLWVGNTNSTAPIAITPPKEPKSDDGPSLATSNPTTPAEIAPSKGTPKPTEESKSLEATMKYLEGALGSIGRVNYVSYVSDNTTGARWENTFLEEGTNVRATVQGCRIDFHRWWTRDGKVGANADGWFSLKSVRMVEVKTREQSLKEGNSKDGHPQWNTRVDPPVFVIAFTLADGQSCDCFNLYDESLAHRIAKALEHGVELCGER